MDNQIIPQHVSDQQPYPLIVYHPEGSTLEIRLSADPEHRTIWATQRQIAQALELDVSVVNRHITKFKEQRGEQGRQGIAIFAIPTNGGVQKVEHYDMTVVTYIGFRAQATERVIQFQNWVGKELDRILSERKQSLTPAELILAQAKQLVEHERGISDLRQRQIQIERWQENTDDRLARVEARQTTMIDGQSQHMSIAAYCEWKNIDSELCSPKYLSKLTEKARQLSRDRKYLIGKTLNRDDYVDTFHLDVLADIFAGYR